MPRVEFSEENIVKSGPSFPKFVLDRGETARIVLLEDPWSEYVHELRKPKLVNGIASKEVKKRKDGTPYEDYEYDFVASNLCLGDPGILKESGSDPSSCPMCAAAALSDRFKKPRIRYAMHVIRYDLAPGSTQANDDPFGARAQVWAFTEKIFGEIYDLKKEWKDLRVHDLILSRDQNAAFPNVYKITPSQSAAWMEDEERQKKIGRLLAPENLAPDLAEFCGRRKPEKNVEFDIRAVNEAWDTATGVRTISAADEAISNVGTPSLVSGLDDILASAQANTQEKPAADAPEPVGSFTELVGSEGEADTDATDDRLAALLAGLKTD